eukprot:87256_1
MALHLALVLCTTLIGKVLSATTCDCSTSCSSSTINDDFIYCKSQESCASADLEETKMLYCFGNEACENADIVSNTFNAQVHCWGYQGCQSADIDLENYQNNLKCGGYEGCKSALITNERTSEAWLGNRVYCRGQYGCKLASITTDYNVECSGYYGCQSSTITSTNGQEDYYTRIYCDGSYGCSTININSASAIYCRGYFSCYNTNINNVDYVSGEGYYALKDAIIDSIGLEKLNVDLYGYKAGYGLQIICRKDVDCDITCDGYACQKTEIIYCDIKDVTISDINPGISIGIACKLSMFQNTYYANSVWCPKLTHASILQCVTLEKVPL